MKLSKYASSEVNSLGRNYKESYLSKKNTFQRDRDRIVHTSAFRRLEYKTQVFVNHEGDLFRTRLTHTIEVAQIARSIARRLNLNEDLVEAICLAHDLGHTPFGHAGQKALNNCMKNHGGFEHNLQSLRIVDEIENKYADFKGLNLTFETREGILKHCSKKNAKQLGELGLRFLNNTNPTLEAQISNFADEIAYNNHDIDDGLRSGLIDTIELKEIALFDFFYKKVKKIYSKIGEKIIIYETIRRIINFLIDDLVIQTEMNLNKYKISTINDVRNSIKIVSFSQKVRKQTLELKNFLMKNVYNHYKVNRMSNKATKIIVELFNVFIKKPNLLPFHTKNMDKKQLHLLISDYVAGMTDRYAIKEHKRIFEVNSIVF